jgi:hypothetical protein
MSFSTAKSTPSTPVDFMGLLQIEWVNSRYTFAIYGKI